MKNIAIVFAFIASSSAHAIPTMFEKDSQVPLVFINVVITKGYLFDKPKREGMLNFVGEMLLRGTHKHSKQELDLLIDDMGAKFFVDTQGHAIVFRGAVIKSELDRFLSLFHEILTSPSFPSDEITKLKGIISTGIQNSLNSDSSVASNLFRRFFFDEHPYSQSVLGKIETVKWFKLGDLMRTYNEVFRSNNMMIFGSGDVDPGKIKSWADKIAESRKGGKDENDIPIFSAKQKSRILLINKPERTQTQVILGQHGLHLLDQDYFPLYVGNFAFGGGSFSSRLFQEIRVKRGWSYGAQSFFIHARGPHSWRIRIAPATKDTAAAVKHLIKMLGDLKNNGITKEEFEFSRKSLINSDGFRYDTPQKRIANTIMERLIKLPKGFQTQYANRIEKLSISQVNAALKRFIKPETFQIAILGSADKLIEPLSKALNISKKEIHIVDYRSEDVKIQ